MGLDGGTIATRTDLLRRASWRLSNHDGGDQRSTRGGQLTAAGALDSVGLERTSARTEATDGFESCSLSGAQFPRAPAPGDVVACALGRLYCKTSVVEWLTKHGQFADGQCDASALNGAFGHIERLRDCFSVVLEPNPRRGKAVTSSSERMATGGEEAETPGAWICPVDRDVCTNGLHAFCALRPCGHVLRLRVAQELAKGGAGSSSSRCGGGGSSSSSTAASSSSSSSSSATSGSVAGGSGSSSKPPSDGISTIYAGSWACAVCSAPVEVTVRLFADAEVTAKVRGTLRAEQAARKERKKEQKQSKKRREREEEK